LTSNEQVAWKTWYPTGSYNWDLAMLLEMGAAYTCTHSAGDTIKTDHVAQIKLRD